MDFHEDFSIDNNPFAGSNHYLSNGILNNYNDGDSDIENIEEAHTYPEGKKDGFGVDGGTAIKMKHAEDETPGNEQREDGEETHSNTQGEDYDGAQGHEQGEDDDEDASNTTTQSVPYSVSEEPTMYEPMVGANSPLAIKTFQILKDFKGTKTVFYKIENSITNTFVLRRYNDFKSLRSYLCKFYPYLFVPPIPEKHSISRFFKNPFNYKNDVTIIELRIGLLNYFLAKLASSSTLSSSTILLKFLDPLNINWASCLNSPPFTNLSSNSLLLISTENPTKPSPYFSYLPIPPLSLLRRFSSKLNTEIFSTLEIKLKIFLKIVINLEIKVKNLVKLLNLLRVNLVKFGGFLNIFSILENQNSIIEKFGNKIDLNFLNIEILVSKLTAKIRKPIIIVKNSLIYLLQMLHFRKLKELQLVYFQNQILRKQKHLKSLIGSVNSIRKQNIVGPDHTDSPSLRLAYENIVKRDELTTANIENLSIESKRQIANNINLLNNELNSNLLPCYKNLVMDVEFLSVNVEESTNSEFKNLLGLILQLQDDWKSNVWGEYLENCLKIWKE